MISHLVHFNVLYPVKILIVEDEILIFRDIREALEKFGYSVCDYAPTVARAKDIIEKEQPDIAIIDIKLKGEESGIDLGRFLIEKDIIPFIYLTSHADTLTLSEAKKTRPSGYLLKPFKQDDIFVALEIALSNFAHRKIDLSHSPEEFIKSGTPFKIRKVIDYINTHLDERLQLTDLAKLVDMSTFHFARTFKHFIKSSPANYIAKVKVEKSKALLSETDMNVLQIALEVGFENQSHFSQVFKKHTGYTPENYRNICLLKKRNNSDETTK
ncbi:response regulator transcription factor [Flavobacterium sp.]|uniref:response regulator transcription factor n=1 Tax=Flavobacterium sp. TaxID=239 RepID=UPI0026114366|nr:response regulator transcription factor [Flavobacterium sp.]